MKAIFEKTEILRFAAAASRLKGRRTDAVFRCYGTAGNIIDSKIAAEIRDQTVAVLMGLRGQVMEPGTFAVSIERLAAICNATTESQIQIETSSGDEVVSVQAGRSRFKISKPCDPESIAFPDVPDLDAAWEIESKELARIARLTAFVTDQNATKYAMAGTRIGLDRDDLVAQATDGKRASHCGIVAARNGNAFTPTGHYGTVVPVHAVGLLGSLAAADKPTTPWLFGFTGNAKGIAHSVTFWNRESRTFITSQLLEGRFPDISPIWPKPGEMCAEVAIENTADFAGAIQAAAITTTKESVGVVIEGKDGKVIAWSSTADAGDSTIAIEDCCQVTGRPFVIMLDHKYAAQAFGSIGDNPSTLRISVGNSPIVLTGDRYRHAIMGLEVPGHLIPRLATKADLAQFAKTKGSTE